MEFKGTKGEWKYFVKHGGSTKKTWIQVLIPNKNPLNINFLSDDECNVASCCATEDHANALLISKSYKLLIMLEKHLGILKDIQMEDDKDNIYLKNLIYNTENLLKEATEL